MSWGRCGANIILIASSDEAIAAENGLNHPCFLASSEQLIPCPHGYTGNRGFDVMAVNVAQWNRSWVEPFGAGRSDCRHGFGKRSIRAPCKSFQVYAIFRRSTWKDAWQVIDGYSKGS